MEELTVIYNGEIELSGYSTKNLEQYIKPFYLFIRNELIDLFDYEAYNRTRYPLFEIDMEPISFDEIDSLNLGTNPKVPYYLHGDVFSIEKLMEAIAEHINNSPEEIKSSLNGAKIKLVGHNTMYHDGRPLIYEECKDFEIITNANYTRVNLLTNRLIDTYSGTEKTNKFTRVLHSNTFIVEGIDSYLQVLSLINSERNIGGETYKFNDGVSKRVASELIRLAYCENTGNRDRALKIVNELAIDSRLYGVDEVIDNFERSSKRIAKELMLNNHFK